MANAVSDFLRLLPTAALRRRGGAKKLLHDYELDLPGFLNGALREELTALLAALSLTDDGGPGAARQRLWAYGAAMERRALGLAESLCDATVQAAPMLRSGKLVIPRRRARAAVQGMLPVARIARFPSSPLPRPLPLARALPPPAAEPPTLDALLARADALVGVRLGARVRDKGFYGHRVAELLGLARSSSPARDWRGEVEVKTLAVVRAAGATWRIKDGPALSMRGVDAKQKLGRVLWVIRIDEGEVPDAPVLSWFYQELAPSLAHAFERARHLRPKGGKGTTARGWYLRRDYFVACGLLASLNG